MDDVLPEVEAVETPVEEVSHAKEDEVVEDVAEETA